MGTAIYGSSMTVKITCLCCNQLIGLFDIYTSEEAIAKHIQECVMGKQKVVQVSIVPHSEN